MDRTVLARGAAPLALAVIGLAIASGPVFAQQAQEITVQAPRVVHQQVGRLPSGGTMELITLTHRVSYADLDLRMQSGAATLETRINDTAREGCKQLDALYPVLPSDPECFKKAVDGGMAQAKAAIAAANK